MTSPQLDRAMTPVAQRIYPLLRARVPATKAKAVITYGQLGEAVGVAAKFLANPLGELVLWCRREGLPAISALVVNAETGYPGEGYYGVAHGLDMNEDPRGAIDAWQAEVTKACAAAYP